MTVTKIGCIVKLLVSATYKHGNNIHYNHQRIWHKFFQHSNNLHRNPNQLDESMEYLRQHYNKEAVLDNIVGLQSGVILENFALVYEHLLIRRVHILPLSTLDDPLDLAHLQKQSQL
jgi:hypothetical protein